MTPKEKSGVWLVGARAGRGVAQQMLKMRRLKPTRLDVWVNWARIMALVLRP
jgi:hypothetical protein